MIFAFRNFFISFFLLISFHPQIVFTRDEVKNEVAETVTKLSNSIKSMIKVLIKNKMDPGSAEFNGSRNTLNTQTAVPLLLLEIPKLKASVILPLMVAFNVAGGKRLNLADLMAPDKKLESASRGIFISNEASKNLLTILLNTGCIL